MLWCLHVPGATSARVYFRKTSVVLPIWGLGLIPLQIMKAERLGTGFNLSFWNSSCKKQPQIGKAQVKYIFFILSSKSYPNEIYHWKANCVSNHFSVPIIFVKLYLKVWLYLVNFPQKVEAGILYFLSRETLDYNWLIT